MRTIIHRARLLLPGGPPWPLGYLVMADERIQAVSGGECPASTLLPDQPDQLIIDAAGGFLLPGLIDAHCHLGLFDDGLAGEGADGNEATAPVTAQLRALDGIYQEDRCFQDALAGGVTTVMSGPGSANVLAGAFALIQTAGRSVDTMAIRPVAAMKAALGENPKQIHGSQARSPQTRMATAAILREALHRACQYQEKMTCWCRHRAPDHPAEPAPDFDMQSEALQAVIRGEMPVKFHAHRSDDILTAVRIANEFGLRYTLDHCTEGYRIADILAAEFRRGQDDRHGCGQPGLGRLEGVIVGPLLGDRGKPELRLADPANAARLAAAGLPVAIMTDHPELPVQYLMLSAALAVQHGLSEDLALAAITSIAARLCDVEDRLGSLESGKQADVVLWSGHPLQLSSQVRRVFIKGRPVWPAVC